MSKNNNVKKSPQIRVTPPIKPILKPLEGLRVVTEGVEKPEIQRFGKITKNN